MDDEPPQKADDAIGLLDEAFAVPAVKWGSCNFVKAKSLLCGAVGGAMVVKLGNGKKG